MRSLLFPKRCPICDEIIPDNIKICHGCATIPRRIANPRCMKCGKHIENPNDKYCRDCERKPGAFVRGVSAFEYDSVHDSIFRFKNAGRPEYADYYADRIVAYEGDNIRDFEADALIPIPLHPSKLKKRGYNQSELIADELSKRLGIPVEKGILVRTRKTKEQKKLTDSERQKNIVGAFHIAQNGVKLLNVVLVDDVYTTGSTIDEAARTLLASGVQKVYFVTVAVGIDK